MKNKNYEYKQLAYQLQGKTQLNNKDIDMYSSIFQLGKIGRILVYLVGGIIGFLSCIVLNISFWWTLVFVFGMAEIIGLYVAIKGRTYSAKLLSKIDQQEHLKQICNIATNFTVVIELKASELAKRNKRIDSKKATQYENIIILNKVDNGWKLSGTKPLWLQNCLIKEPELVIVRADHEFIKNNDYQTIIFSLPEANSKKQMNGEFSLFVSEDSIRFDHEYIGGGFTFLETNDNPRKKDDFINDVEDIDISLLELRQRVFERITNAFQPYNDDINTADNYWSKKYLFKSDEYRKKKLNEYLKKRQEYESSQQFREIKFGSFGEEKTYLCTAFGVTVNEELYPSHKIKYSHHIGKGFFGATHVFETKSFKITIIQH